MHDASDYKMVLKLYYLVNQVNMEEAATSWRIFVIDFISGGIAGSVSRTCVSPFERLKIIFQLQDGKGLGIFGTLRNIWKTEGIVGMFKGNGTNVIRIFPYSAVQFAAYEFAKKIIRKHHDNASGPLTPSERMFAGAFAGVSSVVTTYPLDLIRTRLSMPVVNSGTAKRSILSCGRDIFRKEGGITALFRGLTPTVAGIAPYVALNFTVYEGLKGYLSSKKIEVDVEKKLVCGGLAGAIAQTFTYPFDVVRRRMQVTYSPDCTFKYKGSFDAVGQIVRKEGFRALFKGMVPNYLKVVPAISISFVTFELTRKALTEC